MGLFLKILESKMGLLWSSKLAYLFWSENKMVNRHATDLVGSFPPYFYRRVLIPRYLKNVIYAQQGRYLFQHIISSLRCCGYQRLLYLFTRWWLGRTTNMGSRVTICLDWVYTWYAAVWGASVSWPLLWARWYWREQFLLLFIILYDCSDAYVIFIVKDGFPEWLSPLQLIYPHSHTFRIMLVGRLAFEESSFHPNPCGNDYLVNSAVRIVQFFQNRMGTASVEGHRYPALTFWISSNASRGRCVPCISGMWEEIPFREGVMWTSLRCRFKGHRRGSDWSYKAHLSVRPWWLQEVSGIVTWLPRCSHLPYPCV